LIAGNLRDRITVQERSSSLDALGGPTDSWTDKASLWAEVIKLSGRELFQAQSFGSNITTRVRTRYWPGIKAKQRIVFGSEVLDIESVIPDQKKTQLEIICTQAG
jgi:SPP1 family predicted phage head-tail adaptor